MGYFRRNINFATWSCIHRLPRLFVEWWQLKQLQRTISDAYCCVPLYQKLLDEKQVNPSDIKHLSDIVRFPVLNKQVFLQHPIDETMNSSIPNMYIRWGQTSGTTGEPFRFPRTSLTLRFHDLRYLYFSRYRFLVWGGSNINSMVERMRIAQIGTNIDLRHRLLFIPIDDLRSAPERVFFKLNEFKPNLLESVTSILIELGQIQKKLPPRYRVTIPYMYAYGEALSKEQREYLEEAFDAETYAQYGTEEVGAVALQCKKHSFHINEESYLVEILDENDKPLPNGTAGRVVITCFFNNVMPFIRYDVGDHGLIWPENCSCGIPSRCLSIDGRVGGFLTIGQKKFHHIEFHIFMSRLGKNILKYQFVNTRSGKLELRVIPTANFSLTEKVTFIEDFQKEFGFKPDLRITDRIVPLPDGKTAVIIDETHNYNIITGFHGLARGYLHKYKGKSAVDSKNLPADKVR